MPALRTPGLGPIVGHVTDTTACLWVRARDHEDAGAALHSGRRTIGVIAVVEAPDTFQDAVPTDADIEVRCRELAANPDGDIPVFYFRLHREFDRTGTFCFGDQACITGRDSPPLRPTTRHIALLGIITLDDPFDDDQNVANEDLAGRLPDASVWLPDLLSLPSGSSTACFRTFGKAGDGPGSLNFILGSCRYPGILWKSKEADRIFGPLLHEATGSAQREDEDLQEDVPTAPTDFVLMVGDQIYADKFNRNVPVGLADTAEEFQERYHTAFGSQNMRRLLRRTPTYMILDDHEIEDNWTQDRIHDAESRKVFNLAIGAYMSYQWSHGPRSFGTRLYYNFSCNEYPFFVLDTRTQRFMDDIRGSLDDNHLLGRPTLASEEPGQLTRLLLWLRQQQQTLGDIPKFVVSASVFVPNPIGAREGREGSDQQKTKWKEASDSWPAFPRTRRAILRNIIEHGIQNVVFLSGDIHCANVAEINFEGSQAAENLKAFSITSSAFYWPFFFADGEPSNFVHDSTDDGTQARDGDGVDQSDTFDIDGRHAMDYRAWNFTQDDNFCRVDVDRHTHTINVAAIGEDGEVIRKRNWLGMATGSPIVSKLDLAPW
ncbi:MAG: alkaline phosphatase D family protein [Rhodospirillales bacterium]|nr:alkaline phosphatase D family protein [Rhodospirillales bacterium]